MKSNQNAMVTLYCIYSYITNENQWIGIIKT